MQFKVAMAEGLQMVVSQDNIATVRMNNGENRFRMSFSKAWMKILDEIESNADIKGLIITGHGKIFSLGLDLEYFKTQSEEYVESTRNMNAKVYERLLLLPIPTVAVINGHAYGAGAILAMTCDYRVMRSDRGWICWPEVQLGMRMRGSLHYLRVKIPRGNAIRETMLFGRNLTASEAMSLQIVDLTTSPDQLETVAAKLINDVLGKHGIDRETLSTVKRDVYMRSDFEVRSAKL